MVSNSSIPYTANAKINLGLKVLSKRQDGYHNLHSLLIEIDLADILLFTPSESFVLTAEGLPVPIDESNLISQTNNLLHEISDEVPTEYSIHLIKKIPTGGGLGGGSSNAATTLHALNKLWNLNKTDGELENLGNSLGADVPFFIKGGAQIAEGIGHFLTPIDPSPLEGLHFLLVKPPLHISTKEAYTLLNKPLHQPFSPSKFAPLSKPMKWELFDNDFERIIQKTYPEIGDIKQALLKSGATYASLSGSGSTVFGVFDSYDKASASNENFYTYQTFLASPVFQ